MKEKTKTALQELAGTRGKARTSQFSSTFPSSLIPRSTKDLGATLPKSHKEPCCQPDSFENNAPLQKKIYLNPRGVQYWGLRISDILIRVGQHQRSHPNNTLAREMQSCSSKAAADRAVQPCVTHTQILKEFFVGLNFFVKLQRCLLLLEHTQVGPITTTWPQHLPIQILQ